MVVGTTSRSKYHSLAEVFQRVGDVPADRVLPDPAPGTATEADLTRLIDGPDRRLVELVGGILVEKPMGFREDLLATRIGFLIGQFLDRHNLGVVAGAQGAIRFDPGLVRMPDVSFIRWDSVDHPDIIEDPAGAFLDAPPDLAVEVLSPGNTPAEMAIKLGEYAAAGVKLVWYVDPDRKKVTVYPKGKERGKKVVGIDGVLDGGAVLPGFTLPVATIFAKRAPAKKPGGKKGKK